MEDRLARCGLLFIGYLLASVIMGCEVADIPGMFITEISVDERFKQSSEWNALHDPQEIVLTSDHYQILAMGDSHVGTTQNLDTFLARSIEVDAAAIVLVGDLTTGHAEDYQVFQEHLQGADVLNSFLMVGNHDLYFDGWNEFFTKFGASSYYFTVSTPMAKDIHICLDSGGGTLGAIQLDWFEDILQTIRPAYRHCVVYTHNNLFRFRRTASTNPNVEELVVLLDLFSKYGVYMVITAHDHKHAAQKFGNTSHIVMDALLDGFSDAGYLQLNVNQEDLSYRFVSIY